jgi:ribonuclease HI
MNVEIWVGGSCDQDATKKQHAGGWSATIIAGEIVKDKYTISGSSKNTTTYRMKITAALEGLIQALINYGDGEVDIVIYTDHIYFVNAFNEGWVDKWMELGRYKGILMRSGHDLKTGSRVVENSDLWWCLIYLVKKFDVKFKYVPTGSDERLVKAHELATEEMRTTRNLLGMTSEPSELKNGKAKKSRALKEGRLSYTTLLERKLKK